MSTFACRVADFSLNEQFASAVCMCGASVLYNVCVARFVVCFLCIHCMQTKIDFV